LNICFNEAFSHHVVIAQQSHSFIPMSEKKIQDSEWSEVDIQTSKPN